MSALPYVHVVHAHDAPQHLSTLDGISNTTHEACGSFISAAELKFSGTTRYTFSIPVNEVTSSGFASVSVGVYRPFAGSWINYPEVNNNNMFEKAIKLTVR